MRKKSKEYFMVNFPADVRKNLKGINVLTDSSNEKTENKEKVQTEASDHIKPTDSKTDSEGNRPPGRASDCTPSTLSPVPH